MAEGIARPAISAAFDLPDLIGNFTEFYNEGKYYEMGEKFAGIWKLFVNGDL